MAKKNVKQFVWGKLKPALREPTLKIHRERPFTNIFFKNYF